MKCSGVDVSGYRKGESCGAHAKFEFKGKHYCAVHRTIAQKEPGRFKAALVCWEKAELRRIRKHRLAEALKGTQIDLVDACQP
jgi:hypothetical protein